MTRTLLNRPRSMLNNANLGQGLWEEAFYGRGINLSPSMEIDYKITEEVWTGHSCDYSNLKIFGCEAYALTPTNQRFELDPRSKKCIFVGYDDVTKGYGSWDTTAHNIVISRDVFFYESSLIKSENVRVDVD